MIDVCALCGKLQMEHQYKTAACPMGRKNRVHGYPYFSLTDAWTERSPPTGRSTAVSEALDSDEKEQTGVTRGVTQVPPQGPL